MPQETQGYFITYFLVILLVNFLYLQPKQLREKLKSRITYLNLRLHGLKLQSSSSNIWDLMNNCNWYDFFFVCVWWLRPDRWKSGKEPNAEGKHIVMEKK